MAIGIGRRQFVSALGGTAVGWSLAASARLRTKEQTRTLFGPGVRDAEALWRLAIGDEAEGTGTPGGSPGVSNLDEIGTPQFDTGSIAH
jgi:hypothetical protein